MAIFLLMRHGLARGWLSIRQDGRQFWRTTNKGSRVNLFSVHALLPPTRTMCRRRHSSIRCSRMRASFHRKLNAPPRSMNLVRRRQLLTPPLARVALRRVAEHPDLIQQEFNRAFVLMEYFGYLRRNPNDAPDGNFDGYNFWLNKLNQFNGNYLEAEMVKAFLSSIEYRRRFGP